MKPTSITLATAAGLCLTLSACNSNRSGAEEAVRQSLKDPESARFGDFYYNAKTKRACFTVNAKNAMGGYTGDQQVSLQREKEGRVYLDADEWSAQECRELWADQEA